MSEFKNSKKDAALDRINAKVFYMKLTGLLDDYLDHVDSSDNPMSFDEYEKMISDSTDGE